MSTHPLLVESVAQLAGAWRNMVLPLSGTVLADDDPLSVSIAGVPHFILNAMVVTRPVEAEELPAIAAAAGSHAAGCAGPWVVMTSDDWMPAGTAAAFAASGIAPVMQLTGMAAPALAPPRRPAPPELRIVTTLDDNVVNALFDVNSYAYGMPVEMGTASIRPGIFTNAWCAAGYLGDEPVSVTLVYRVEDCLYVAWVATMPEMQGRGYAEAVIRRALAEASAATGLTRTTLHASAAGQPLYTSMGYEPVGTFTCYAHGLGH